MSLNIRSIKATPTVRSFTGFEATHDKSIIDYLQFSTNFEHVYDVAYLRISSRAPLCLISIDLSAISRITK